MDGWVGCWVYKWMHGWINVCINYTVVWQKGERKDWIIVGWSAGGMNREIIYG